VSQTVEDIEAGLVCMECLQFLFGDNGELCDCCHPVHCKDCFDAKSKRERREIAQYFDPKLSRVITHEERR
jgi:hypothetical protein